MKTYKTESGILSTGATSTGSKVLAPTMVYRTLQEAVRKNLVFRPMAALLIGPNEVPGPAVKVSLQDPDTLIVHEVAEGAELPFAQETYSQVTLTPVKYGVTIGITREMIEDSQFSVVEKNAATAGYALADKEDSLVADALSSGAGATVTGGGTISLANITEAMEDLESNGYMGTDMVVGTEVASDIRNLAGLTSANLSIAPTDLGIRLLGNIFGMNVVVSRNVTAKHALVIDRDHAYAIAEKRPVTLERFDDFLRDTHHIVATVRIATSVLQSNAIAKITTT